MDLNGSSVPATPTHWDPVTRNDRVSATINQPSTAGDTSILRSVEINGSETKCDTAPPDGDDDDVQILFSVPRRRRKKRKRYDSALDCSRLTGLLVVLIGTLYVRRPFSITSSGIMRRIYSLPADLNHFIRRSGVLL